MRSSLRKMLETEVLSTTELAELLGASPRWIRLQAAQDKYESVHKGHSYLFDRLDFKEEVDRNRQSKKRTRHSS